MRAPEIKLTKAERGATRELWQRLIPPGRFGSVWQIPGFRRSLLSLAAQGYVLADIAAMFGVSKERVRQWLARVGVQRHNQSLGQCRVWDASRKRFIAITWKMASRYQTYACACGCGKPTQQTWARGHNHLKGSRLTMAHRRKLSEAQQRRWERATKQDRRRHGKSVARAWQRMDKATYQERCDARRWGALKRI